jgi:hypothetical protein
VNVALPSIRRDFGRWQRCLAWVVDRASNLVWVTAPDITHVGVAA